MREDLRRHFSGNYHPHGEAIIYPTLVRMAQNFNMRYMLVDGQGNFGSVDGDPPAAMRYTEARLTRIAEELLADLEKETVDFVQTSTRRAKSLPSCHRKSPNLLVNGASGIAVGMATNIPPHNLREVIEAAVMLIEKPDITLKEVHEGVARPRFPHRRLHRRPRRHPAGLQDRPRSFIMRAKAAIEQTGKDRESIVITEIPFQVNKARLIERIAELVQTKKIEGISDVRDESDRDGMRIVVEIKRGEESQLVLNNLFKHTQMQESFGVILLAIVNGQPRELPLIGHAAALHRAPRRSGPPPHAIRAAQGRRARAHFAWLQEGARPPRRNHQAHPQIKVARRSQGRLDGDAGSSATARRRPSSICSCTASRKWSAKKSSRN